MLTKKHTGSLLQLAYLEHNLKMVEIGTLSGYFMEPEVLESGNLTPPYFQVVNLFVAEGYRNKGIGTILLQRLCSELVHNSINVIQLDDFTDTGRIYQKFGFTYNVPGSPEMTLVINKHESPLSKTPALSETSTGSPDSKTVLLPVVYVVPSKVVPVASENPDCVDDRKTLPQEANE